MDYFAGRKKRANPESCVEAPWFDVSAIRDAGKWRAYLKADSEEPDRIPERALESYDCRHRVVITLAYLIQSTRLWSAVRWMTWRHDRRGRRLDWTDHI